MMFLFLILLILILTVTAANNDIPLLLRKVQIANVREIRSFPESSALSILNNSNQRSLQQQQQQDECNLSRDHPMGGSVVLDLYGEPHLLTTTQYDEIGKAIEKTYNEIDECGSGGQYRQIETVQLGPVSFLEDLGKRPFTLEYMLSGSCRGCNSTNNRMFYYVDVNGNNQDTCPCQGPSITTFQVVLMERLDALIQDRVLKNLESLDLAAELESAPTCPAFLTFTTSDAVVQLYGCPLTFQESDWISLAERFKETYNRINSLNANLCDRFFREIVSATVILPTDGFSSTSEEEWSSRRNRHRHRHQRHMKAIHTESVFSERSLATFQCPDYFEVRFDITARCRGCDVRDVTLFDQEEDVNFFNSYDDDYFVDTFSNVTTDDDDSTFKPEPLSENNGNDDEEEGNDDDDGGDNSGEAGGDNDDGDGSDNGGEGEGNENDDEDDDDASDNSGQGGNENDDNGEEGRDDGDDTGGNQGGDDAVENDNNGEGGDGQGGDDSREWGDDDDDEGGSDSQRSGNNDQDGGNKDVRSDSGELRENEGNTNEESWSGNDESDRNGSDSRGNSESDRNKSDGSGGSGRGSNKARNRRGLKTKRAYHEESLVRTLETSECRCSIDPKFRAVTESEMISAFNDALPYSTDNSDLFVEDVIEVKKVQCDPMVDSFQTVVDVSFDSDSNDGVITPEIAQTLTETFVRSYNTLAERFCDPYFREVQTAEIMEQSSTPVRRDRELQAAKPIAVKFNFNFRFVVASTCRGCPARKLFGNDAPKRRLVDNASSNNKYRRVQTADQCYCATAKIAESAPSQREFAESYNDDCSDLISKLGNQYNVSMVNEKISGPDTVQIPRGECVVAKDCIDSKKGTLCVNNACLHDGNPRITLTWVGDDDLDLSVYTPGGVMIAYDADFDTDSGGSFDTRFSQEVLAPHVESIFFPISGGPSGTYRIMVDSYEERGLPDDWTIEVFTAAGAAVPVFVKKSTGSQSDILFSFGDVLTLPNSDVCSLDDAQTECCIDDDCIVTDDFAKRCVNRQCITEGARTFTLSWTGNDEYALNVIVPDTTTINAQAPYEVVSGGKFEPDKNVAISGVTFHTQSIFFPHGHPTGEYIFFVDMITQNGVADEWRLEMTEFGDEVFTESGTGISEAYSYTAAECLVDANCGANQVCIFNRCIVDGTPRFTLTWLGDDDYDLSVDPPDGNRIDWENYIDQESGGEFQDDSNPYGLNHVESIYFGVVSDAQVGQYRVRVKTYEIFGVESDSWTLKIIVGGNVVRSWSQTGDATFRWQFAGS